MASKEFCDLIDKVCSLSGLDHPELLYDNANLIVDDIAFTLTEGVGIDPHTIFYFCEFGEVPEQYSTAVLQRLLELNYLLCGVNTPTFGLNDKSECVTMMAHFPLADVSAEALLRAFTHHAAMVKEWRRTYLLVDPGQALPTAKSSLAKRPSFINTKIN